MGLACMRCMRTRAADATRGCCTALLGTIHSSGARLAAAFADIMMRSTIIFLILLCPTDVMTLLNDQMSEKICLQVPPPHTHTHQLCIFSALPP